MSDEEYYKSIESISIPAFEWKEVPLQDPATVQPASIPAPKIEEVPLTPPSNKDELGAASVPVTEEKVDFDAAAEQNKKTDNKNNQTDHS